MSKEMARIIAENACLVCKAAPGEFCKYVKIAPLGRVMEEWMHTERRTTTPLISAMIKAAREP